MFSGVLSSYALVRGTEEFDVADSVAGLYGAAAVMIALRDAESGSGHGQVIDLPLLDPLFHVLGPQAANYRLTGRVKPRTGSRSTNSGPRNAYKTKDGKFVALSASTQKMAERTLRAQGYRNIRPDSIRSRGDNIGQSAGVGPV